MVDPTGNLAPESAPRRRGRGWWRVALLLVGLAGLVGAARVLGLGAHLVRLQAWIAAQGPWGPIGFVGLYVLATVLAFPGTVLGVLAGPLFGTYLGTVCISIGSTIGAALCFLIARHLVGERLGAVLRRHERWRRLDALTARHGSLVVAIARLVPLFPFNLLNYAFGLTSVRFGTYVAWSWLCMLPGTLLYVSGGDVAAQVATGEWRPETFVVLGLASLVVVLLAHEVRRRLHAREPPA